MTEPLPQNPFLAIYGKSAVELVLLDIDNLKVQQIQSVIDWVKQVLKASNTTDLREPTVAMPLFENHAQSLIRLAAGNTQLSTFDPDYDPQETEETAALLLASALIRRESVSTKPPVSSSEKGEEAAKRRGWKVLEDAITVLKEYEDEIVTLGSAVLRKKHELLAQWQEDVDDGTFLDAAEDVRRRLDFVEKHKEKFQNTAINEELLTRGEKLYADAMAFFRGREGRQIPKTQLTLARDESFTLLLRHLEDLRPLLRAAYRKNAEALAKIDGTFWRKLERLSKPRKKRKGEEKPTQEEPPTT